MNRTTYQVFITGSTGYLGRHLIPALIDRGHRVKALARPGSVSRVPPGCETVVGNALQELSYASYVAPAHTLVHLVGVSHPSPARSEAFLRVDLASVEAAMARPRPPLALPPAARLLDPWADSTDAAGDGTTGAGDDRPDGSGSGSRRRRPGGRRSRDRGPGHTRGTGSAQSTTLIPSSRVR